MVPGKVNRLSEETKDQLFLGVLIILSFLPYIGRIGFYSDDWAFFGASYSSTDRSLWGLYHSFDGPVVWMRPVQVFYLAALFKVFDLHPLGYHVVNHLVFLCGILIMPAVLRRLNQDRIVCFAVPLIFGLLPHYSTDRLWPILFCANLSMTTYFLSLYCDLRMLKETGAYTWVWKLLGVLFLLIGTLAYEVFLPLFLLNFLLVWAVNRRSGTIIPHRKLFWLFGINFFALLFVIFFKAETTTRIIMQGPREHVSWFLNLMIRATDVSFGDYGIRLPFVVTKLLKRYLDWKILGLSLFAGILSYGYFYRILRSENRVVNWKRMLLLFLVGILIFVFGYLIFVTNENADPTPAGLNNRTSIAAAVGVALCLVGFIGWISSAFRSNLLRKHFFCALLALICTSGILITNTILKFWIQSFSEQEKILSDIRVHFRTLPSNSTLILDGVCPYVGPAVVFESNFDLAGALRLYYQDFSLKADVVKPSIKITDDGLQTTIYGATATYPYRNLYIFHHGKKVSRQLNSSGDARQYFETFNPLFGLQCPDSREGVGVPIF